MLKNNAHIAVNALADSLDVNITVNGNIGRNGNTICLPHFDTTNASQVDAAWGFAALSAAEIRYSTLTLKGKPALFCNIAKSLNEIWCALSMIKKWKGLPSMYNKTSMLIPFYENSDPATILHDCIRYDALVNCLGAISYAERLDATVNIANHIFGDALINAVSELTMQVSAATSSQDIIAITSEIWSLLETQVQNDDQGNQNEQSSNADSSNEQKADGEQSSNADSSNEQAADGEQSSNADGSNEQEANGEQSSNADGSNEQKANGEQSSNAESSSEQEADGEQSSNADSSNEQEVDGEQSSNADSSNEQAADGEQSSNADGSNEQDANDEQSSSADSSNEQGTGGEQSSNADRSSETEADGDQSSNADSSNEHSAGGEQSSIANAINEAMQSNKIERSLSDTLADKIAPTQNPEPLLKPQTTQDCYQPGASHLDKFARYESSALIAGLAEYLKTQTRHSEYYKRSGRRISQRAAIELKKGNSKIFRRVDEGFYPNTAVSILVDLSASMREREEAVKIACISLLLACANVDQVKIEVLTFQGGANSINVVKPFYGHNHTKGFDNVQASGGTPLQSAISTAAVRLLSQQDIERHCLWVLTDGEVNDDSKHLIRELTQERVDVLGMFMGHASPEAKNYMRKLFGESWIHAEKTSDINTKIFKLAQSLIIKEM
ncbi:VWA domain-containing protein [Photobacterium sp. GB-72]|uniref:VWA domain-containing protein n=1 Tax=Photobacterium sp. GB-72 TaxID=2022105 RepID=UPI000D174800|nr:VWA domain-containing protein [Photobacterium sp. GB-72]PSV26261.1 hypothetical protein C9J40_21505 [Photobacterium sp. GB-72]